jgi:hypothetical protein
LLLIQHYPPIFVFTHLRLFATKASVGRTDGGADMAQQINRLSAVAVPRLIEPGIYPDGGGLYLSMFTNMRRTVPTMIEF